LSHIKDQEKVVGSICVNPANGNELSFKYRHPTFSSPITELSVLTKTFDSVVPNWACFFNSILIPEKVVQRVGRPNPKLFLWGDEVEYFHRILDSGIKIETLLAAKHSHPLDRLPVVTYRGMHVYNGDMNWKAYCFYRNRGFIHKKFYKYFGLKNIAIEILFQFRNKNFFRALRDSLFITKAHLHGIFRYLDKKLPF
jgi:rhamnopyranosyl-N-acetylglucosaminyl-diphospho-decaprenol beta-1,3/1,4-galactofuranosyltransferase